MSLNTLGGLLGSLALFLGSIAISTDRYGMFVSVSSAVLVIGGTFACSFLSYEARYVILALKLIGTVMAAAPIGRNVLKNEIGRIIKWAYAVQKNGIVALEEESKKAVGSDKLLKFGVDLVISGYSGDDVREILDTTVQSSYQRNCVPVTILKYMAGAAPAFGMIGTLVGLIIMLASMGGDPASLGAGLAVALLTTLYGVLFSRMIFIPISTKLQQREDIIRFRNTLVVEGLVLLAYKKPPRYIQDRMNSYLDPAIHFNIDTDKEK